MRAKKHVVVLMGGMSVEHDVSLDSGKMVVDNLDAETYKISQVVITRRGEWLFTDESGEEYLDVVQAVPRLKSIHPDCVFIAMHGPGGEDGRLQGMFDILGIPYVGSGCEASAICMDKIRSKILAAHAGIPLAEHLECDRRAWDARREEIVASVEKTIGFPCVVKSTHQGSSLATIIAQDAADYCDAVEAVLPYGEEFMVERFIKGRELAVSVLDAEEDEEPIALPITEIRPAKDSFFNYHAKYTPGASVEITPAEIPDAVRDRAQDFAVRAHKMAGCRGLSRSDMILAGDDLYWLEINTIPGLTQTSLFPQAAEAAGISFTELLGKLVESALIG